jgi:uncharacterized oligopeptide transporter (OPT) family protein
MGVRVGAGVGIGVGAAVVGVGVGIIVGLAVVGAAVVGAGDGLYVHVPYAASSSPAPEQKVFPAQSVSTRHCEPCWHGAQ